jgi:hypothetical protein
MRRPAVCILTSIILAGVSGRGMAAEPPTRVDQAFLQNLRTEFQRSHTLSPGVLAALNTGKAEGASGLAQINSIPHWDSFFMYQGTGYPYSMAGGNPVNGGITHIPTAVVPVNLFFQKNNLTLAAGPILGDALNSPDFRKAVYGTGNTEFSDAIQRAEFSSVMGNDWHTIITPPRRIPAMTISVPANRGALFVAPSGAVFGLVEAGFFQAQLNTVITNAGFQPGELAMVITNDAFLYFGTHANCCVIGFHTAFETGGIPPVHDVQTLYWASWIAPGIFGGGFEDVTAISHEIAEWENDPFINNLTPPWQFPGVPGSCQGNLETGDPVEVLANATFPVTLHGFVYHPQTEALFQWFTREVPSSAFGGAYSYPDMTALTAPSQPCQ